MIASEVATHRRNVWSPAVTGTMRFRLTEICWPCGRTGGSRSRCPQSRHGPSTWNQTTKGVSPVAKAATASTWTKPTPAGTVIETGPRIWLVSPIGTAAAVVLAVWTTRSRYAVAGWPARLVALPAVVAVVGSGGVRDRQRRGRLLHHLAGDRLDLALGQRRSGDGACRPTPGPGPARPRPSRAGRRIRAGSSCSSCRSPGMSPPPADRDTECTRDVQITRDLNGCPARRHRELGLGACPFTGAAT